jgi:hypothetical protein
MNLPRYSLSSVPRSVETTATAEPEEMRRMMSCSANSMLRNRSTALVAEKYRPWPSVAVSDSSAPSTLNPIV